MIFSQSGNFPDNFGVHNLNRTDRPGIRQTYPTYVTLIAEADRIMMLAVTIAFPTRDFPHRRGLPDLF